MRLSCLAAEPLAPSQVELDRAHEAERARALADLIDRLSARLGARAVTRRALVEAHLPEQAEAAAPATLGEARTRGEGQGEGTTAFAGGRAGAAAQALRPSRADRGGREVPDGPPLRFRWRRVLHDVAAIEGPERIAAAVVAPSRRADARLFPRRGFSRPPLLALPRRPLGPRDAAERNGSCTGCSGEGERRAPFAPLAGRRWPAQPAG